MSDSIDTHRDLNAHKKALRAKYGVACPECVIKLPKANPTILLPKRRCRIHNYVDPRPDLTDTEWSLS